MAREGAVLSDVAFGDDHRDELREREAQRLLKLTGLRTGARVMVSDGPAVFYALSGGQALVRLVPFETGSTVNGKPEVKTPAAPWRVVGFSALSAIVEPKGTASGIRWP